MKARIAAKHGTSSPCNGQKHGTSSPCNRRKIGRRPFPNTLYPSSYHYGAYSSPYYSAYSSPYYDGGYGSRYGYYW